MCEIELKNKILAELDISESISDNDLQSAILKVLKTQYIHKNLDIKKYNKMAHYFFNSFRKLDMLQDLIEDKSITEIMINGPDNIFIERNGHIFKSDCKISSKEKLLDIIQQIVFKNNKIVNEYTPIVDTRLKDGSRVNIVLSPIAINGPIVTIRKFPDKRITMKDLINYGSISQEAANFLQLLVKSGYNIFISGGTGCGKTTFLNVLSDFIGEEERIIVIEDTMELQITNVKNIVRLETRNVNTEGKGEITIRDLIRTSLRMRPDRIIVGEVRGEETIDMLQALNTGHKGSLSTGHANNTRDMLTRLETMYLSGIDIPLQAIKKQIASALDIIVHLGRLRDKSRHVLQITEILGFENNEIKLNPLYEFKETSNLKQNNKIIGELVNVGNLQNKEKLFEAGIFK